MVAELIALAVLLVAASGEVLHQRRIRRVARLAYGPSGRARPWTRATPFLRVAALAAVAWACAVLILIGPGVRAREKAPEGGERHLILALDVSPSMNLTDAGSSGDQTRRQRADQALRSILERIPTDQVRISIIAFYTDARPVVVETYDLNVVHNILNDLPLHLAFDVGKTDLFAALQAAADLARPWPPDSTTVLVASDGDTVPNTGLPNLPPSVRSVTILGVGDPARGTFIDGHQSRQDVPTLRQVANRLGGVYHDGNRKNLPSDALGELGRIRPLREQGASNRRRLAVALLASGSTVLAFLPFVLALFGNPWQDSMSGNPSSRRRTTSGPTRRVVGDGHVFR